MNSMPKQRGVTEFQSKRTLSNPNPVNPNRDSPNGYPTVTPTELQPVTLAH